MKAVTIEREMMKRRYSKGFILPRYRPRTWWECDLFEVTKAGFFVEYEIKLTRADFARDVDKQQTRYEPWDPTTKTRPAPVVETKYGMLAAGSPRGPKRFWYVAPAGLINPVDVPAFAGLIEVDASRWVREIVRREAPVLHKAKVEKHVLDHANSVCYWRYHNLRLELPEARLEQMTTEATS